MVVPAERQDRTRLDGFELEIFKLVRKNVTSAQWREWLRVPLEHAAADGNEDLFTRLMDAGADGSAGWRGCNGRTLLGAAAHGKSKKIAVTLLEAGAQDDLNVVFGEKRGSALHVAAARGAGEVSRVLMIAGADPNLRDLQDSRTPLHVAAETGHDGVVGMLLLKGALPDAKTDYYRQTALHLAARSGHDLCVSELLLAGADKDSRNCLRLTPLHLAAQCNRLGALGKLVAAGANLHARDSTDWSPFHFAACKGHVDAVRALLRHGSRVEESVGFGLTALHNAALLGCGDIIRVLLEAGANIEASAFDGDTPLHTAISRTMGSRGTFRALLEGGANVHSRNTNGVTPLHKACSESCIVAAEFLLRWGADETLADHNGDTPADEVGKWEDDPYFEHEDSDNEEDRLADDLRIRHMLARAPADRRWRRRGWLVLARRRPAKVQLATVSGENDDCRYGSTKIARSGVDGSGEGGDEAGNPRRVDLQRLVGRVLGLDVEGVFRLVVGFL